MNERALNPNIEEPAGPDLADLLGILRRRIWYLVLPAVLIFAVIGTVAMLLPATYRSTATILIEQQQIPQDLVRTTVTSYADQRVQTISQRVMTTANLSQVIEKYDLFREERKRTSLQSIVEAMREDIALEMIEAEVIDPRSGSAKSATIAFSLAFENESPQKAQQVANELVSLFLNENLRKRQEAADETANFLQAEADRLAQQISGFEAKFAQFKQLHGDNLPEMQQINIQFLQRTEDQIERNALDARLLEERIFLLESELGRTSRYGDDDVESGRVLSPKERLVQLELEYMQLSARVKENHPDRILLEREINTLRRQTGGLDAQGISEMLQKAREALVERRRELADTHPDVLNAERVVRSLEEQLTEATTRGAEAAASQLPENPVYQRLAAQLESARVELSYLKEKKVALQQDLATYEKRIKDAPKIEREFSALTRDYDNAVAKYREIKSKEMEAELAQSLETERKAERFVLIEPPLVPNKPVKPNRVAIVFLGAVLAVGGGFGTMVLREMMSPGMHGSKAVTAVAGVPPMAVIPRIRTAEEMAARRRKKVLAIIAALLLFAGALGVFHLYVRPLDIAVYKVMLRLELIESGVR